MGVKLLSLHIPISFLYGGKIGDDKSAEAILSRFIIYFHNMSSLRIICTPLVVVIIIIYIFGINKR